MTEKELSKKSIVQEIENLRNKVNELGLEDRVTLTKYSDHLKINEIELYKEALK
ncbi:hypothetical protein H9Y05_07825 [Crocinitomicaceae bacterium CZZ-1]|uniref:Uncharacterized protein n=1 Tax=Taishania pollutisoli TaxID=2766479 RepID=A0A8J6PED2_9FLAO|nr:hypothetical protein [Taishania pollutisoli]MBC9812380.1 hypothetical protein [Taishania pollutisoli]